MENNELTLYNAPKTELKAKRNNYELTIGNFTDILVRDVDFGKIPKTTKPILFKSGAEKILLGFGLYYNTEITDSYKDYKSGFFYYEVKATAFDQNGNIVRTGVGCCNTNESAFGSASSYNSANNALKKAKKRAVVDLALTLGALSDAFTQDLDDESNEKKASELLKDSDFITAKQVKRIFAIASNNEITTDKAKALLSEWGFSKTSEITQADYDKVCEKLQEYGKSH